MQCNGTRRDGERCRDDAIRGAAVCRRHGGSAPQVRNAAAIRDTVSRWMPGKQPIDAGEIIERLATVAYERAEQHATELDEVLGERGWRDAFVGDAYGEHGKVGEYARQLAVWEASERRTAADLAVKIVAANLAERNLRLDEQRVALVVEAMRRSLVDAGLGEKVGEVIGGVGRHLRLAAS